MTQTAEKVTNLPQKAELRTGGSVAAIVPQDIEQAYRMAHAITAADMAPKSFDRKSDKVLVAILHGMEVGMTPMAAIQSIAVINGMPSIWGDGALALVLGSGLVEDFNETLERNDDGQIIGARCEIKRKGRKTPIVGEFTYDDAVRAKLTKKPGPWQDYPNRMLKMRARAFALRDGFADVLKGLRIGEEVQDMGTLERGQDGAYVPRPQRGDYVDVPTVEAEPEASEEPEEEAAEDPGPEAKGYPEYVDAEAEDPAEDSPEDDPAAQYRVFLQNKPNARLPDWSRYRNDVVSLAQELGADAIPHIEAANAATFEEMASKGKQWFDAMWRDLGALQE